MHGQLAFPLYLPAMVTVATESPPQQMLSMERTVRISWTQGMSAAVWQWPRKFGRTAGAQTSTAITGRLAFYQRASAVQVIHVMHVESLVEMPNMVELSPAPIVRLCEIRSPSRSTIPAHAAPNDWIWLSSVGGIVDELILRASTSQTRFVFWAVAARRGAGRGDRPWRYAQTNMVDGLRYVGNLAV
jgi:hypothetical protein